MGEVGVDRVYEFDVLEAWNVIESNFRLERHSEFTDLILRFD